ncbi:hypothetical protein ACF3MZ_18635 [Paenibacillaceae bacterium WGS1546]|uniref:hypothetical protein n=1 Tax=Cohnella sp. WGS1546 TaxID=3366810 RepID=UPI00372D4E47
MDRRDAEELLARQLGEAGPERLEANAADQRKAEELLARKLSEAGAERSEANAADQRKAEELLARKLSEEGPERSEAEAEAQAAKRLLPRWEIRIQAELDPVVEETRSYRAMAQEVDGRYDKVKLDADEPNRDSEGHSG